MSVLVRIQHFHQSIVLVQNNFLFQCQCQCRFNFGTSASADSFLSAGDKRQCIIIFVKNNQCDCQCTCWLVTSDQCQCSRSTYQCSQCIRIKLVAPILVCNKLHTSKCNKCNSHNQKAVLSELIYYEGLVQLLMKQLFRN